MRRISALPVPGLRALRHAFLGLFVLGSLNGCLSTSIRYLDVRGRAPTPSTLPLLAPSPNTRATVRVGAGLSGTTSPGAQDPHATLDLQVPSVSGQIDGILFLGSHVVLGYRQVVEGGDVLLGIVGRPGPFEILGYGATGLRRFPLDRTFERTVSVAGFASDTFVDTVFLDSRTWSVASTIGLSCLTNLVDGRLQPFASASLQMGPRLSGEMGGDTERDRALTFGAATFDVGARAHLTTRIAATAGAGLVGGTGTFDDTWGRGFATLEWTLTR